MTALFTLTRRVLLAVAAGLMLVALPAAAGTPFDPAAFEAAQTAGKSIVVEVTAPWCPTCKQQKPIVQSLMESPEHKSTLLVTVDFDSQKDVLKRFNVQRQATFVVYKGKDERGRSTYDTNADSIKALFAKAL